MLVIKENVNIFIVHCISYFTPFSRSMYQRNMDLQNGKEEHMKR